MVKRYSLSGPATPSISSIALFCTKITHVISRFRYDVHESFAPRGCDAVYIVIYRRFGITCQSHSHRSRDCFKRKFQRRTQLTLYALHAFFRKFCR
jgi:hypothetical protein